jgi:hypothetical protein
MAALVSICSRVPLFRVSAVYGLFAGSLQCSQTKTRACLCLLWTVAALFSVPVVGGRGMQLGDAPYQLNPTIEAC